jgi:hypothetical protein
MDTMLESRLPRPRHIEMTTTPEFNEMKRQILKTIRSH